MAFLISLFRWLLTLVLAVVFVALFIPTLVVSRVNATVLEPDFYIDQLREADFYNFLHDEVLPFALDEATENTGELAIDVSLVKEEALPLVREVFPPEWLQVQVERSVEEVVPYLNGDTDSFNLTVSLADRVETAGPVVKRTLREGAMFGRLYDDLISRAADEARKNTDILPFGLQATRQDLLIAVRTAVPKKWLLDQSDQVIDEVVPYLAGESEHFAITISFADRVDASAEVIKDLVRKGNTYQFLIDEAVTPAVKQNLGQLVQLPFGVSVSEEEVLSAFKQVVTEEWVLVRMDDVLDTGVDYLTGRTDTLELNIPLADRKVVALEVLNDLADSKLETLMEALPVCTMEQMQQLSVSLDSIPTCRPPGITYSQAKGLLGIDIDQAIQQTIGEVVPDQWLYTEDQMRLTVGQDSWELVQQAREWVSQGITYTDADLRNDLDADSEKMLDDILDITRNGFTFTDADLREALVEGSSQGEDQLEQFDQMRDYLKQGRSYLSFLPFLLIVLLVTIGFVGGRGWWGRLRVASGVLTIASLIVFVAVSVGTSRVEAHLLDFTPEGDIPAVMLDKAKEMAINLAQDFLGGLRTQARTYLVVSAALFVGSMIGGSLLRRKKQPRT